MPNLNDAIKNPNARQKLKEQANPETITQKPFEKGVVVKVILDQTQVAQAASTIISIDPSIQIERVPRNTLIVRRITDGADSAGKSLMLAYPFFSSHFAMPIKAGETVWLIFDKDIRTTGYWMTRVHGDEASEDANYSHYDRGVVPKASSENTPGTIEKAQGKSGINKEPAPEDFPNFSLKQLSGDKNEYAKILDDAGLIPHVYEPIPRIAKRPGDLILQGSNNSLIALTTDRGWSKDDAPESSESNVYAQPTPFSGTIDLVAGRSRWISRNEKSRTNPEVMTNSRGYIETSKDSRKRTSNILSEGDPDFLDDAARIYISMNSLVDTRLSLADFIPIIPGEQSQREEKINNAAVAIKSDQVRIIARKDAFHDINGSIQIIKEGEKSDSGDHCAVSLLDDGTVMVTGRQIFIGKSNLDGGIGEGPSDAPDEMQPYVRYQQLEDLLTKTMDNIIAFTDQVLTHVTPGFGVPSPQINVAAALLKGQMIKRKTEIQTLKSKRIFGE